MIDNLICVRPQSLFFPTTSKCALEKKKVSSSIFGCTGNPSYFSFDKYNQNVFIAFFFLFNFYRSFRFGVSMRLTRYFIYFYDTKLISSEKTVVKIKTTTLTTEYIFKNEKFTIATTIIKQRGACVFQIVSHRD